MLLCSSCVLRFVPFRALLDHPRYLRPIVKLGKDKFQVCIDVRQFNKDEIRVKARKEFIVIEGKQERKMKNGFVIRQFERKYKLPSGCNPHSVYSTLKPNGMLTVTAPREVSDDINLRTEIPIPIKFCSPDCNEDPQCAEVEEQKKSLKSLCDYYLKKDKPNNEKDGQDQCNPPPTPPCPPCPPPPPTCPPPPPPTCPPPPPKM